MQPALYHYFAGLNLKRIRLPWRAFDPERKYALADAIAAATALTRPDLIAFQTTAWMAMVDGDAMSDEGRAAWARGEYAEGQLRPSERPDRVEIVQLLVLSRSDAEAWWSEITRDGRNPPSFAAWHSPIAEATPAEIGRDMTGRMLDPIRKAMWGR